MKFVKLNCTRGGLKNPTLKIGKGKDEITLEEAQTLVGERMAVEYFPEVLSGSTDEELKLANAKVEELEGKVTTLEGAKTELEGKVTTLEGAKTELEGKVTELQGQLDLLDPKTPVAGKK